MGLLVWACLATALAIAVAIGGVEETAGEDVGQSLIAQEIQATDELVKLYQKRLSLLHHAQEVSKAGGG